MAITYDKNLLRMYSKMDDLKLKKHVKKQAITNTLFNIIVFIGFEIILIRKNMNIFLILICILLCVFMFIFQYLLYLMDIKKQKKTYDESIAYFKIHDPEFLESIIGKI